ncbi:MAG: phosphopantothenoylcysteine decarboxylase, partial [Lentisphaeraceae bacterium]|nr:phosphopantothenoylcysteine decarboxylase [Lentisphaeraceae bacterium]
MAWDLTPPPASNLHDQDVTYQSDKLQNVNIALLICGSIAAYDTPNLIRELRRHGASIQAFASSAALNFVTPMALEWTSGKPAISNLTADAEHLGGNKEFDIFLVAPASYNTINKFALGIADS